MRGALAPPDNCNSATARRVTRTCWMPPSNKSFSFLRSLGLTLICRAGRAMPILSLKTFLYGIVLLENLQAVRDLEDDELINTVTARVHPVTAGLAFSRKR